jgi:flagellar motor component MotA
MARFIISLVLLLASIMGAVLLEGGNPLAYLGFTALIVELLVPLFAMLAVWRLSEIGHAFGDAFSRKRDDASRTRSARIWEFTEKVCYAAGVIGLILGTVLVLARVSASVADLGRAVGVSFLAPLYGVLFGVVCRILKARVEHHPD